MKGDCLSCSRISRCTDTSVEKILADYTCVLYDAIEEPVYKARVDMIYKFGELQAVTSMLDRPVTMERDDTNE